MILLRNCRPYGRLFCLESEPPDFVLVLLDVYRVGSGMVPFLASHISASQIYAQQAAFALKIKHVML